MTSGEPRRPLIVFDRLLSPLARFVRIETSGGIVLLAAMVAALVWANLPGGTYESFWGRHLSVGIGHVALHESLETWVNDGVMTIFFFVVGLEIKRELAVGELNDPKAAALPGLAAAGGMVVPALIYFAFNAGGPGSAGWGIPMATDIAFVLGVIALLSRRIPAGIKLFMLTLAIADDVGAIVVIAIFYTETLGLYWLLPAIGGCIAIMVAARLRVPYDLVYVAIGVVVWYATLRSGIHPTIAGVAIALLTPAHPVRGRMVLDDLERTLQPVSSFLIVPIFALANAGVELSAHSLGVAFGSKITWGVLIGLLVGKTIGISVSTGAGLWARIGRLPRGIRYPHLVGASTLGGIGFTVALFIASLTFGGPHATELLDDAKIGILAASLLSGVLGSGLVLAVTRRVPSTATVSEDEAEPAPGDIRSDRGDLREASGEGLDREASGEGLESTDRDRRFP